MLPLTSQEQHIGLPSKFYALRAGAFPSAGPVRQMTDETLRCFADQAGWSREKDAVQFPANDGSDVVMVNVTRAGLAALAGKDRSEISAEEALALFAAHTELIVRVAGSAHGAKPRTTIIIDYPEIERAL